MSEHGAMTRHITSRDGTRIMYYQWPAPASPRGAAVLFHGYGEHLGRYGHVAAALSELGLSVSGCDFRGHGLSDGPRAFVERFSDYLDDLEATLNQVAQVAQPAGEPTRPVVIIAHSMGALVAVRYLLEHPTAVSAAVLSSPFFRFRLTVPRIKELAGRFFSIVLPRLSLPSGLRGADVSRDPEEARKYDADPLNNKNANSRWYTETLATQETVCERAEEITLPLLCLYGGDDRIADADRTAEIFARIRSVDKKAERLPGQFHEVFNEPLADRERTLRRLTDWVGDHLPRGVEGAPADDGAPRAAKHGSPTVAD